MVFSYFHIVLLVVFLTLTEAAPHYLTASRYPQSLVAISETFILSGRSKAYPDGIVFSAATQGDRVVLVFTERDFNSGCSNHYINIYDGQTADAPLLKRVCPNDVNITVVSTGDQLFVFYSYWDFNAWFEVIYYSEENTDTVKASTGLSSGSVGGIVGGVVVVLVILGVSCFCYRKGKTKSSMPPPLNPVAVSTDGVTTTYPTVTNVSLATYPFRSNTVSFPFSQTNNAYATGGIALAPATTYSPTVAYPSNAPTSIPHVPTTVHSAPPDAVPGHNPEIFHSPYGQPEPSAPPEPPPSYEEITSYPVKS